LHIIVGFPDLSSFEFDAELFPSILVVTIAVTGWKKIKTEIK